MKSSTRPAAGLLVWLVWCLALPAAAQPWAQDLPASVPLPAYQSAQQLETRRQSLAEDRTALDRQRRELRVVADGLSERIAQLKVGSLSEAEVEQARVDAQSAQLRLDDVQVELTNTERRIRELEQSIRDLEAREQLLRNPAKGGEAEAAARASQLENVSRALAGLRVELELERQHRENLLIALDLARQRLALAQQWRERVEEVYRLQQEQVRREAQVDLETRLLNQQRAHLAEAENLSRRLEEERGILREAQRQLLNTRIELERARAKMIENDLRLSRMENDLSRLESLADRTDAQAANLQEGLQQLKALQTELEATRDLLARGSELGAQQQQIIEQQQQLTGDDRRAAAERAKLIGGIIEEVKQRRDRVQEQLARAAAVRGKLEEQYRAMLSRNLLDRRTLPDSMLRWQELAQGIVNAPWVLAYQVQLSVQTAVKAMIGATPLRWLGVAVVLLALLWLVSYGRRTVDRAITRASRDDQVSFFRNLSLVLFLLVRKNLFAVGIAAALLLALWIVQVPQPGFGIIATLVLLYLAIKAPINLAWLLLGSSRLPPESRRPQLYRLLSWTLFVGGLLAAVTILAHLSSLPVPVTDAFDRLFMLYLLLITWPVLRLRGFLHERLSERFGSNSWFILLRVILLVLPLSLTAAALLGLVGYVNLAWSVAWHLVAFVLVLIGWLVVRGLFNDLVVVLKNYAVTHSGYGLLWTQEVINPLHRISEVLLFLGAWVVLFQAYGLEGDSAVVARVWQMLEQPLFSFGGADISLWRIIVTVVSVLIIVWLAQWTRAVAYRWLFSRIIDLGVRHSLSVFFQYAIVLIGLLVILRSIGLDLTTLTVFAGAVGVGIGFGMQAIANNFVSGLLLLIERPLRSGDIVKIGTNEGTVTRIGIRSLTMETFDKQEVIIPNSDVITNAFTNWTHTDSTMRTVLLIRVSYEADPARVKTLIERVVFTHPAVLGDPEPLVLLWEFGDSTLLFRVQYFIDVIKKNLLQVRSEIMFGIWDALKKAGLRVPVNRQELYVKEWPEHGFPDRGGGPGPAGERAREPRQDPDKARLAGM